MPGQHTPFATMLRGFSSFATLESHLQSAQPAMLDQLLLEAVRERARDAREGRDRRPRLTAEDRAVLDDFDCAQVHFERKTLVGAIKVGAHRASIAAAYFKVQSPLISLDLPCSPLLSHDLPLTFHALPSPPSRRATQCATRQATLGPRTSRA